MDRETIRLFLTALVGLIGSGGGAWIGIRVSIRAINERVARVERELDREKGRIDTLYCKG